MNILFLLFIIFVVIVIGAICLIMCHMVCSKSGSDKYRTRQSYLSTSGETQLSQAPPSPVSLARSNLQTNQRTSSQNLQVNSTPLLSVSTPSDLNCSNQYREGVINASFESNVKIPIEDNKLVKTAVDDQPPSYAEATEIRRKQ